jgi:hypothetical protein
VSVITTKLLISFLELFISDTHKLLVITHRPFNELTPAMIKANPKAGHASVCPEDVMYLSYPMGPALNISTEMTQVCVPNAMAY